MSTTIAQPRLRVAFAGTFSLRLEERVRAHLGMPCDAPRSERISGVGLVVRAIIESI
jgi:hypothetical protein